MQQQVEKAAQIAVKDGHLMKYRSPIYKGLSSEMPSLPNLRRLFIEARSEDEERTISRKTFYNAVLFLGSVAVFSLVAQKMNTPR